MRMSRATLFTVGYEQRTVPELLKTLKTAQVRTLIDVRELPLSRRKGFSKTKLGEAVRQAGVTYEHARLLGNPKPYRRLYMDGDPAAGAVAYRAHLHNGSYPALLDLADRLDEDLCLLCVEHEHELCHRAVIVESLQELRPDLQVTHL